MKTKLVVLALFIFIINSYSQQFEEGTIITKRYDTIANVKIQKISDAKSLTHLTYVNSEGKNKRPNIETIKCYTRGNEKFVRVYYDCEMILVKVITSGKKVNLYEKNSRGKITYFIEKVYDELVKVTASSKKFAKEMGAFLADNTQLSKEITDKKITDINKIVSIYNK
jgi:hypothetical protein